MSETATEARSINKDTLLSLHSNAILGIIPTPIDDEVPYDIRDLVHMKKIVSGTTSYDAIIDRGQGVVYTGAALDFNVDGQVGNDDIIQFKRYLLGIITKDELLSNIRASKVAAAISSVEDI